MGIKSLSDDGAQQPTSNVIACSSQRLMLGGKAAKLKPTEKKHQVHMNFFLPISGIDWLACVKAAHQRQNSFAVKLPHLNIMLLPKTIRHLQWLAARQFETIYLCFFLFVSFRQVNYWPSWHIGYMQGLVYHMILIDRWPLPDCSFTNLTLPMQAISIFFHSLCHTTHKTRDNRHKHQTFISAAPLVASAAESEFAAV